MNLVIDLSMFKDCMTKTNAYCRAYALYNNDPTAQNVTDEVMGFKGESTTEMTVENLLAEIGESYEFNDVVLSFRIKVKTRRSTRTIFGPNKEEK